MSQPSSVTIHPQLNICRRSRRLESWDFQPSAKKKGSQCWRRWGGDGGSTEMRLWRPSPSYLSRLRVRESLLRASTHCLPSVPLRGAGIIKVFTKFILPLGGSNSPKLFSILFFPPVPVLPRCWKIQHSSKERYLQRSLASSTEPRSGAGLSEAAGVLSTPVTWHPPVESVLGARLACRAL